MHDRINYRTTVAAVAVAVACTTSGAPSALAQNQRPVTVYAPPSDEFRTERVSYRDLNLATRTGEEVLTKRVAGAVRRVCSVDGNFASISDKAYFPCARSAWGGARPQMAQAIARAHEIALYGRSSIAATAITISAR